MHHLPSVRNEPPSWWNSESTAYWLTDRAIDACTELEISVQQGSWTLRDRVKLAVLAPLLAIANTWDLLAGFGGAILFFGTFGCVEIVKIKPRLHSSIAILRQPFACLVGAINSRAGWIQESDKRSESTRSKIRLELSVHRKGKNPLVKAGLFTQRIYDGMVKCVKDRKDSESFFMREIAVRAAMFGGSVAVVVDRVGELALGVILGVVSLVGNLVGLGHWCGRINCWAHAALGGTTLPVDIGACVLFCFIPYSLVD